VRKIRNNPWIRHPLKPLETHFEGLDWLIPYVMPPHSRFLAATAFVVGVFFVNSMKPSKESKPGTNDRDLIAEIERLVQRDEGKRGISEFIPESTIAGKTVLECAAQALFDCESAILLTGEIFEESTILCY